MTDETFDADRLARALDGVAAVDGQTRALTSMAHELSAVLRTAQLDTDDRTRIFSHAMRLLDSSAVGLRVGAVEGFEAQARRTLSRVHVGRRGGVVLGGVAAASVAAAIGYAVLHDRRRAATL